MYKESNLIIFQSFFINALLPKWVVVYNGNKLHINTPIFPDKIKFVPFYYKYNQKSMSSKGLFMLKILVRLTCVLTP